MAIQGLENVGLSSSVESDLFGFTFEDTETAIQTINLAFLGAEVDIEARNFLMDFANLDAPGALDSLSELYVSSSEFENSYAGTSNEAFVRSTYFNLFDRNTDFQEVTFWTDQLDSNAIELSDLPFAILGGARESDIEAYEAKIFIADYFTDQQDDNSYVPDDLTTQSLRSNAELYADLAELDAESDFLTVAQVGESLGGNPLYTATVGTGDREVVFITQQHGDEPMGTEAALYFLDFLISDTAEAAAIREGVTVTVLPRVNPDGFARWELEQGGVRGVLDPRVNDAGQDLNRTYDPANPFGADVAPESVAVRNLLSEIDPDLVLDYHGQGNYRNEDGDLDTMSILWPTNPDVDRSVRDISQQAVVAIDNSTDEFEFAQVTRYPGSDNPAIARNGFSLDGTPGVLVEQRYSQEMFAISEGLDLDYSALRSALALEGFITMKAIASGLADGSIYDLDPQLALDIPDRSPGISYASLYGDDAYTPTVFEELILI